MPPNTEDLIERAKNERTRGRYEEALVSAIAAADKDPENANAWWQVALNRLALGDARNAVPALNRTVKLAPHFASGWAHLGSALLQTGEKQSAQEAFERALQEEPEQEEALEALADVYFQQNKDSNSVDDKELSVLTRLEEVAGLSSPQLNRIGALHYMNKDFFDAIKYWERDAAISNDPASLFNLGLAYNHSEVSQDADAVDIWRLTAKRFPDFQRSKERIADVLPRLLGLAKNARDQGKTLLPQEQWYSHYLSPFELLKFPADTTLRDFDAKMIQRLKKSLFREIELEEGRIQWLPGVSIDKSKAIAVCEELNDETNREFHSDVFQDKPLLDFLSRGSHEHFLVNQTHSPLETIELLEDESNGFREWLSEPFAKQFDRLLSKAIEKKNLIVLECMLDGRRWVAPSFADRCFENARRQVDRLLQPLREARVRADDVMPTVESIKDLLTQTASVGILNLLPTYFRDLQNEAVSHIRGIAINCFNSHSNSDLSREILEITRLFRFKSADLNHQLDDDFKKIEALIRDERKHEVRLTSGSDDWKITKEGAVLGARRISAKDAVAVRWGAAVTREAYGATCDFLLGVRGTDGREIKFSWKATTDLEKNNEYFNNLINACIRYVFPEIVEKIESRLKAGERIPIGPCTVAESGVQFETKGWIFASSHFIPWSRVHVAVANGELMVSDIASPKAKTTMSVRETDNAMVLRFLAHSRSTGEER